MKKVYLIILLICVVLISGITLVSCVENIPDEQPPVVPTLEKSSFSIFYSTDEHGAANYELRWSAQNAVSYSVNCDGSETSVTKSAFPLNGYSADTVHTVTVKALGNGNTQSAPVEVKFKGTRLEMPINVRLYGDTNSFGWKGCDDTFTYVVSCEELDLDISTSKPIGTGRIKTIPVYSTRLGLDSLRSIYGNLNLYSLEKFRVQALPYNGNMQVFEYSNDTDVIEFLLPSQFSEQSVNFYAGTMSNPSNVRWDFNDFADHPSYATVKWDGADSNYKYKVLVKYPEGYSIGTITDAGASQSNVSLDYRNVTGDYAVTVESVYDVFNFIGESVSEKWTTYMIYLPQPVTEILRFSANQTVLEVPKNVRVEENKAVWDDVEHAEGYSVRLIYGEKVTSLYCKDAQLSLQEIAEALTGKFSGEYDCAISVMAYASKPELAKIENGTPLINTYLDSEYCEVVSGMVRVKTVPTVSNVRINYDSNEITWDGVPEATSYSVGFYNESGGGYAHNVGLENRFNWNDDISQYSQVLITAMCEYEVTFEGGIYTVSVPSVYKIDI